VETNSFINITICQHTNAFASILSSLAHSVGLSETYMLQTVLTKVVI